MSKRPRATHFAAIFDDPQHPYTIGLMSSVPSLGKRTGSLATVPGMVPTVDTMPDGCRFAPRCPFASDACRREVPPLRAVGGDADAAHRVACVHAPLEATFGGVAA